MWKGTWQVKINTPIWRRENPERSAVFRGDQLISSHARTALMFFCLRKRHRHGSEASKRWRESEGRREWKDATRLSTLAGRSFTYFLLDLMVMKCKITSKSHLTHLAWFTLEAWELNSHPGPLENRSASLVPIQLVCLLFCRHTLSLLASKK